MHRCACSRQALETFIADLTALQRPRTPPRAHLQRRRFGTRAPSRIQKTSDRRFETVTASSVPEDGYIPFVCDGFKAKPEGPVAGRRKEKEIFDSKEWEPEIQLTANGTAASVTVRSASVHGEVSDVPSSPQSTPEAAVQADSKPVDVVSLQGVLQTHETLAHTQKSPLLPPGMSISPASEATTIAATDARIARKLRRMEAGKYRPQAEARTKEEAVDAQLKTVLGKIEQLEPNKPPVQFESEKPKPKTKASAAKTASKPAAPEWQSPKKESWQVQKAALEAKFADAGWHPRKRLSPDTLEGIRALRTSDPHTFTTPVLAEHFKISPEVIRRILKSKWQPSEDEVEARRERWERRGVRKWSELAEQGVRPPKKWREMGVGSVKGSPDEKPAWKRGGRRSGDVEHPRWEDVAKDANVDNHVPWEGSLAERIL